MVFGNPHSDSVSLLSLLVAMGLRIAPWPGVLPLLNPDWVLLAVIYWTLAIPERFGVGKAWLVGFFTDVLTGRMLGQYALAYSAIAYLCVKSHKRMRHFPLSQQAGMVFLLLVFSQLLIFWTENIQGHTGFSWRYWLPSWIGAALWPAFYFAMRRVQNVHRSY